MEVGRGPYVGEEVILHWNATSSGGLHAVGALGFITDGVDGVWQFSPIPSTRAVPHLRLFGCVLDVHN